MSHKEIQDWYSDMRKTSWIYPDNSRVLNWVVDEPEEELPEVIVEKCQSCFLCRKCFLIMCQQGVCKENQYNDFLESPICDDYICVEEVNS